MKRAGIDCHVHISLVDCSLTSPSSEPASLPSKRGQTCTASHHITGTTGHTHSSSNRISLSLSQLFFSLLRLSSTRASLHILLYCITHIDRGTVVCSRVSDGFQDHDFFFHFHGAVSNETSQSRSTTLHRVFFPGRRPCQIRSRVFDPRLATDNPSVPSLAFQLPHNLILRQSGNSSCFSPLRLAVPFPPLQICASLHITPQMFSGVRGFEYHTSS